MSRIFTSGFLAALLALGACSLWPGFGEHGSEQLAREDDSTCVARGYHWPAEAYIDCRMDLQDARARRNWQQMQMTSTRPVHSGEIPMQESEMTYRPLRRDQYRCERRTGADGSGYIACGEF